MNKDKIVIMGRSGSGKSSLLKLFKGDNFYLPIIEEIAREVLDKYSSECSELKQRKMLELQLEQEEKFGKFITDRGLHDYVVFSEKYFKVPSNYIARLDSRYSMVFRLPRRPFLKEGIRVEDNENEAELIQQKIEDLYVQTNHTIIDVPNLELLDKYNFIKNKIEKDRIKI